MTYTKIDVWNDLAELRATIGLTIKEIDQEISRIMNKIDSSFDDVYEITSRIESIPTIKSTEKKQSHLLIPRHKAIKVIRECL